MNEDRELVRRASVFAGVLVSLVAVLAWPLGGLGETAGALVGGIVTIANFRWLGWMASLVYPDSDVGRGVRTQLWLTLSCCRFGLMALILGAALASGWVGWAGVLGSLVILPAALVVEGLRAPGLS